MANDPSLKKKPEDRYIPETVHFSSYTDRKRYKQYGKRQTIAKQLTPLGVEILNRHGDERYGLTEVDEKVIAPSEVSIYLPATSQVAVPDAKVMHPVAQNAFGFLSEVVGRQTRDLNTMVRLRDTGELVTKHLIAINPTDPTFAHQYLCYEPIKDMMLEYHVKGTFKQKPEDICTFVASPSEAVRAALTRPNKLIASSAALAEGHSDSEPTPEELIEKQRLLLEEVRRNETNAALRNRLDFDAGVPIAVFCSASTDDPKLIQVADTMGRLLAENNHPVVTGGGNKSMMQATARGAHNAGGVNIGYNTMLIVGLEGVPVFVDKFHIAKCIYTRMAGMIGAYNPETMYGSIRDSKGEIAKNVVGAKGLILLAGGLGSVQEAIGQVLEVERELPGAANPRMKIQLENGSWVNIPLITVNTPYAAGGKTEGFHEPFLNFVYRQGLGKHTAVVETSETGMEYLEHYLATGKYPAQHYEYVADRTSDTLAKVQSELAVAQESINANRHHTHQFTR